MVFTITYKKVKDWKLLSLLAMLLLQVGVSRGQVYTFTTAGATGINGPTQVQVDNAYASTTLANNVTVTGGIQNWSVPAAGLYKIEVLGANGYGVYGGKVYTTIKGSSTTATTGNYQWDICGCSYESATAAAILIGTGTIAATTGLPYQNL